MKDISTAISAFQTDIEMMGLDDRVLGMTLTNRSYEAGTYNIDVYNDGLPASVYFLRLQNNFLQSDHHC